MILNEKRTRAERRLDGQKNYDDMIKDCRSNVKLSEKPYILQAVQQDERLRGNGVPKEKEIYDACKECRQEYRSKQICCWKDAGHTDGVNLLACQIESVIDRERR